MYYHISQIAGIKVLKPSIPTADKEDKTIPRVCAAPTMWQAELASGASDSWGEGFRYVYAIEQEPDLFPSEVRAFGVEDAITTGEVWWLTPTPCTLVETWEVTNKLRPGQSTIYYPGTTRN